MNRLLVYGLLMKKGRRGFNGKNNRCRIVKRKRESGLLQSCSRKSSKLARNEQGITEDGKDSRKQVEELLQPCYKITDKLARDGEAGQPCSKITDMARNEQGITEDGKDCRKQDGELLQPCSKITDKLARDGEAVTDDEKHKRKSLDISEDSMTCEELDISAENIGLCGIPLPLLPENHKSQVTFVLENASLALGYVGKRYQILNPDEHGDFLRKKNKNPYSYRPDIVHRTLLGIMDSPLRMAGRLRAVYIKTDEGHLIRVEPNAQIPISLQSFCNMIAQLLQKFHIKGKGCHGKLLRLVPAPVTDHLPVNALRIGFSEENSIPRLSVSLQH